MRQYCRYCANAYLQDDDMIWCEPKDEIRTGSQITRMNRCPHFELNPIDVLNPDREYKPVGERRKSEESSEMEAEQLRLFDEEE